ncbi:MAG: hypothetical protein ABI360_08880 [Allobranchiibius sp.]
MTFSLPLAAELDLLTAALYDPTSDFQADVAETALVLAVDARLAVTSFLGLSIIVTEAVNVATDRVLLRLTLLDDASAGEIGSSLRLPGTTDGGAADQPTIQLVLYAATPGAFVDIAAEIFFLTRHDSNDADLDQHLSLAREPDITGVMHAGTVIGEAVGVLLARGHTHEEAYGELDALVATADTDRLTEATGILAALTPNTFDHSPW